MAAPGADVLDEGLTRIARTGPEFGGGLSNHAPMAAEALVRLGCAEAVEPWLDGYLRRLDAAPRGTDRITGQTWRDALGVPSRVGDWEAYLRDQLAQQPWRDVLARWWPRLLPGAVARPTYDALWQVCAALHAVYAGGVVPQALPAGVPADPDAVTDRAVATGDEHAIKLTEACLRLHEEIPDPVFLHAAARASDLLG